MTASSATPAANPTSSPLAANPTSSPPAATPDTIFLAEGILKNVFSLFKEQSLQTIDFFAYDSV